MDANKYKQILTVLRRKYYFWTLNYIIYLTEYAGIKCFTYKFVFPKQ